MVLMVFFATLHPVLACFLFLFRYDPKNWEASGVRVIENHAETNQEQHLNEGGTDDRLYWSEKYLTAKNVLI